MSKNLEDKLKKIADKLCTPKNEILHNVTLEEVNSYLFESAKQGYELCKKEYEQKLRWISPNIKPKLMDENSMFSVNVSIRVEGGDYEYSGYYNFSTKKWLIYPKEEPFEYELISGWRYFL